MTSLPQDEWSEIAAATREQFRKLVPMMPAMEPGELESFMSAMRNALFLELNAHTFDAEVEQEERKSLYGD